MVVISTGFMVAGLILPAAHAILVTPGSPCSSRCGNVLDATSPDDLVCSQDKYTSGPGQVFEGCVECEVTSGYSNEGQTDTQWMLYNLRYAVSYCLFGTPENDNVISTPCITSKACGPFRAAIEFKNLSSDISSYDYCAIWPVTDHLDFKGCTECLQAGDQEYLANFVTVLQAGCEQQPRANVPVSFEGDIFSTDDLNVTDPTPIPTVNPEWFDDGPISLGGKVGIAFGALAFALTILGCCIIWNGKRRRRAFLQNLESKQGQSPTEERGKSPEHRGWPTPLVTRDMHETPLSQKPFRNWEDSPLSARSEKTFPRYFSPYSSQYNSPVSATEVYLPQWPVLSHESMNQQSMPMHQQALQQQAMYQAMQQQAMQQHDAHSAEIRVALGRDDSSPSRPNSSKGKDKDESYEMHPVDVPYQRPGTNASWESSLVAQQQLGYFVDRPNVTRYSPSPVEDERWKRAGL